MNDDINGRPPICLGNAKFTIQDPDGNEMGFAGKRLHTR